MKLLSQDGMTVIELNRVIIGVQMDGVIAQIVASLYEDDMNGYLMAEYYSSEEAKMEIERMLMQLESGGRSYRFA